MSYEKYYPGGWQSGESGGTPITPEALNHIENGIKQTYSDFAPAGYGWGEGRPASHFTANNVNRTAVFVSAGEDMPTNDSAWLCEFYATSSDGSGNYGHMVATCQGGIAKGCICYRLRENGVYGEWEWLNPPMVPGVEYRTTERWNDKVVYAKAINLGAVVTGTTKLVTHNLSASEIVRYSAKLSDGGVIPYYDGSTDIKLSLNPVYAIITSNVTNETATVTVAVWYTKD